ncbi:MAG: peroxiredoxin-like family protein [Fimbriimonadaceae bacterium]|nr:peroxiredoxin-like family protein [Fimbriimonadaceae bacterium]
MNRGRFWIGALVASIVSAGCQSDESEFAVTMEPAKEPPAAMGLLPSPQMIRPVAVGTKIQWTPVRAADGKVVDLAKMLANQPTVVVFYRGGWCPFCNRHLQALGGIRAQIERTGYRLIAVSPESPEALKATATKNDVSYDTFSDERGKLMRVFNVAFAANEQLLPLASLFVVDRTARVRFRSWNHDYKVRMSADEVMAAIRGVSKAK